MTGCEGCVLRSRPWEGLRSEGVAALRFAHTGSYAAFAMTFRDEGVYFRSGSGDGGVTEAAFSTRFTSQRASVERRAS